MDPVRIKTQICVAEGKQPIRDIYVIIRRFKILQEVKLGSRSFILPVLSLEFTMDFRRCFGLRAPRPIGDSTLLVPQLENYSLFATPFLDLQKKTEISSEEQRDFKSQSEENATTKRATRQTKKKKEEDAQKLPKETSQTGDNFGIVLNVVTVQLEQLVIALGKGNEIEVKVKQVYVGSDYGSIPFSRKCAYKYELPDDIDKNSLVALWTSDDFLIILPETNLREDLLSKSRVPEESAEIPDKDVVPSVEETGSEDLDKPSTSKSQDTKPKKSSKSKDGGKKTASKKSSDQDASELVTEEDFVGYCDIALYRVDRMLRPGLDILMLRKYMVDLESYVSTARNFVENASFVQQNSKSAERCIRYLSKISADEFYEKANLKEGRRARKARAPSPDSGYSTTSNPEPTEMERANPMIIRQLGEKESSSTKVQPLKK